MKSFLGVLTAGLLFAALAFAADLSLSLDKFSVLEDPNLLGYTSTCSTPQSAGKVDYFSISGCTAMPCTFIRGNSYTMKANMTCGQKVSKFYIKANAIIIIPFLVYNGAEETGAACEPGALVSMKYTFDIPSDAPQGRFQMKIECYGVDEFGSEHCEACRGCVADVK